MRNRSKDASARIVEMRVNQGLGIEAISQAVGLCTQTVHRVLRAAGVPPRGHGPQTSDYWSQHDDKLVELYATTTLTYTEIAEKLAGRATSGSVSKRVARLIAAKRIVARPANVALVAPPPASSVRTDRAIPPRVPDKPLPERFLTAFVPPPAARATSSRRGCQWPYEGGLCCPEHAAIGKPYCEAHQAIARRPTSRLTSPSSQRLSPPH